MENLLRVGVDIGSTTVKMVILDDADVVLGQWYERHFSNIKQTIRQISEYARPILEGRRFSIVFTGSAGMGVAKSGKFPFVQEVIACTKAIRCRIPQTDVAIELGGEDAKITYLKDPVEQRMNGVCAGGTGAFIDQMATLLDCDAAGLNELAKHYESIYPIASRCGVFAKTDVQALMNDGVSKEDIAASIFHAVVNQTIGNLAQGRPITGTVAFLGGPLYFLSELKASFIDVLELQDEQIAHCTDGCYFGALGAALNETDFQTDYASLVTTLTNLSDTGEAETETLPPLFDSEEEYEAFVARHDKTKVAREPLDTYEGKAYLGIDAGSTTTKLTLISESGALLYSSYCGNHGSPLDTVVSELKKLYEVLNDKTEIACAGVTGYGEHIIKAALKVDVGEVETVAHLTAANQFAPGVTFVLDIGGQDMKSFFVRNGVIDNIMLNEACSAGCGSFLEGFARSLGITIQEFVQQAVRGDHPVDLGTRCTVFMNSKVKQAQKEGATVANIAAGLAMSVVKNALFKVIRIKHAEELGEKIVVQGGTFYNDAVLRSMEQLLGREVIRPDISGLMGAYGIAIIAKRRAAASGSTLLGREQLAHFEHHAENYRCNKCGNQCVITVQHFSGGGKYQIGNRCERGIGLEVKKNEIPNMYDYKYKRVFGYRSLPLAEAKRGMIGIPRVLNMFEDYPFWHTFFTNLGYRVVLSGVSSKHLFEMGMDTIPSDSLCYPAKLVHGHIADLVRKGIKKIFYPCIPFNCKEYESADNQYNCPIVTSYPENIRSNMESVHAILFMQPFLPLDDKKRMAERLYEEFKADGLGKQEIKVAVEAAYAELDRYKADVRAKGQEVLDYLKQTGKQGIVLAGRPYHIDGEINHGLPELLTSYGLVVLSEDALPAKEMPKLRVVNQWTYHARLYAAAEFIRDYSNLELMQMSSFGCGLDAVTIDQVKELLDANQKIYTIIKLDEINNLGAARIRVRSLLAVLEDRKEHPMVIPPRAEEEPRRRYTADMKETHTILAPQLSPIHFDILLPVLARFGYRVVIPPLPSPSAIAEGLKYVNNEMCYPTIVVVGQLLQALQSGQYDLDKTSIILFQSGGACRATNYLALMRKALKDAGMGQVPVFAAWGKDTDDFKLTLPMMHDVIKSMIYGDLLMRVLHRVRPYEQVAGSADALYRKWADHCKGSLLAGKSNFNETIRRIVAEFDSLPIHEDMIKPKVGIVGEILVKYHPTANNHIVELLEREGCEVVLPDFIDFFLYCAYDNYVKHKYLSGKLENKLKAGVFIKAMDFYRHTMNKELARSRRFHPTKKITAIAKDAEKHVSLGNMAGEGWLLTADMLELIKMGADNIVCLQPFGCLPNHIVGKGMVRELLRSYPKANIAMIDCDAGASEVNQENRIKLMVAVAKEKIAQQLAEKA